MRRASPKQLWDRIVHRRRRLLAAQREFEALVERSERLAAAGPAGATTAFEQLVIDAIDRLPHEFQRVLDEVPVLVSDRGAENHAYGWYEGDGVSHGHYPDRIVIFQDTLERDFGHRPELLAGQVERTLRHELAHHLGWGERGVRDLGL